MLSSFAVAVPYIPVVCMTALAFGFGAKLVRDGEIAVDCVGDPGVLWSRECS